MIRFVFLSVFVTAIAFAQAPITTDGETDAGSIAVKPGTAIAGEFGTWTVSYTVESGGIATGGGIRVQMPDVFHAGPRNSANALQHLDAAFPNYVAASTTNARATVEAEVETAKLEGLVKHQKVSLDGRSERYVFVVRVHVKSGALMQGDVIAVTYGDTSGGSPGCRAGDRTAIQAPILAAVDAQGDGAFTRIASEASIDIVPGAPYQLQLHAPSQAVKGDPFDLIVAVTDREYNPVSVHVEIDLKDWPGNPKQEATRVTIPAGEGYTRFQITPEETGIMRLNGHCAAYDLDANSNPIRVTQEAPETNVYWGDVHSHTRFSWDGVGDGDNAFEYARDIAGLDFYARTDHSIEPKEDGTVGLHAAIYDEYVEAPEKFNDPGRFVTIHAYECSFGRPYGHHNVYFRGMPGPLANPQTTTLEGLWGMLKAGDALTIPHHTGKFPSGVDFRVHNEDFRRNFELYSGHGLSETYDPVHPLAFEQSEFTSPGRSRNEPQHAQDAWRWGLQLSTVSGSDDHRGQPGKPQYGLTAVRAESLTRDAVFQSMYDRRTYATTGAKILLDFTIEGSEMGSIVAVEDSPQLRISAHGTDTIKWVELLRYVPEEDFFEVIKRWEPMTIDFKETFIDKDYTPGSIYYTRLQQTNIIRNRVVMAWSSPIWTK